MIVAALYVDPQGPYYGLPDVEAWGLPERDALAYEGPHPVVAHPPCGPWSRLSHQCKHQDASCGPRAVEQVRRWGGVLEHPADSKLWAHCGLPLPGEPVDAFGGRTFEVLQCEYGHVTRKRTWLYCVRTPEPGLPPFPGREPTHSICNGRGQVLADGRERERASALQARLTPPAFAARLIEMARGVTMKTNERIHSPSSIKLAQKCRHAWALCYIDGIREPEVTWDDIASGRVEPKGGQRSKAIGTQMHAWAEIYLSSASTPAELAAIDWDSKPGLALGALLPLLPPKGSVDPAEIEAEIALVVDGVRFKGFADLSPDGEVWDHKSTRDIRAYALLPDAVAARMPKPDRSALHPRIRAALERADSDRSLKNDLQACVYALWSARRAYPVRTQTVCRWNYTETGKSVRALPVVQVMPTAHALAVVRDATKTANSLTYKTSAEAPPNPLACGDYGGCWYRGAGHCKAPRPYGTLFHVAEQQEKERREIMPKSFAELTKQTAAAAGKAPAPAAAKKPAAVEEEETEQEETEQEETEQEETEQEETAEASEGGASFSELATAIAALIPVGLTLNIPGTFGAE